MRKPVIIGDDVWIGPSVTILKGVRIGAGAWIEAGSVVARDVAEKSRVMGNPAKVIGQVE
jgi:maltose O-acetyltransferase